ARWDLPRDREREACRDVEQNSRPEGEQQRGSETLEARPARKAREQQGGDRPDRDEPYEWRRGVLCELVERKRLAHARAGNAAGANDVQPADGRKTDREGQRRKCELTDHPVPRRAC